jgi:hypothetical protein
MFEFVIGVVVGAAFAPMWMKLFNMAKAQYVALTTKTDE